MYDVGDDCCIEYFQDKTIQIFEDRTYSPKSNDNINNYSLEYFSKIDGCYNSRFGIIIKKSDKILNSVIILGDGGYAGPPDNSRYIIEDNFIIICCGNTLFSISLPSFELNWTKEVDFATAFEIYKMNDDYIIRGELTITRIDKNGEIIWQKYGSDIFVTPDSSFYFKIIGNNICTISWDGREYKFDYNNGEDKSIK